MTRIITETDIGEGLEIQNNKLTSKKNRDTKWRRLDGLQNMTDGFISVRRVGDICFIMASGGRWDTFAVSSWDFRDNRVKVKQGLPQGFRGASPTLSALTHDGRAVIGTMVYTGTKDADLIEFRAPNNQQATTLLRAGIISYPASEEFPDESVYSHLPIVE